ncbi:hypothetical protein C8R43DRAFT_1121614 [Mycena crocata]|nr:hypothetical protein C8R43DRAFT_1121614 [Mycena crocata]
MLRWPRTWFPRRSRRIPPPESKTRVPLEILEMILLEVDNESLLVAACACRVFNARCMLIFMHRVNLSPELLASGSLAIHSHILRAFQVSLAATPPIHTLRCLVRPVRVLRSLILLQELILRSPKLNNLQLEFPDNLITANLTDTTVPYSPKILVRRLSDVLAAMAAKTSGLVVIIHEAKIYQLRRKDLLHRTVKSEDPDSAESKPCLVLYGIRAQQIHKINVRIIPASEDGKGLALITFGSTDWPHLELGPKFGAISHPASFSQLPAILPHITRPHLEKLEICQPQYPSTLHPFLLRHPTIETIDYSVLEVPSNARHIPVCTEPLALPSLTKLQVRLPRLLGDLLESVGDSPQLRTIALHYSRQSPAKITALNHALRCISHRTAPTRLELFREHTSGSPSSEPPRPLDDEEREIAGLLRNVDCVHIRMHEVSEAQGLIPWLVLLPALVRVEVTIKECHNRIVLCIPPNTQMGPVHTPAVAPLMEELKAALPRVAEFAEV